MSGGIGFVTAGKNSSIKNRGFLKHTDKVMSRKPVNTKSSVGKFSFKKTSKKDLDRFKKKFKSEQKRELRKQIIIGVLLLVIIFYFLYLILL